MYNNRIKIYKCIGSSLYNVYIYKVPTKVNQVYWKKIPKSRGKKETANKLSISLSAILSKLVVYLISSDVTLNYSSSRVMDVSHSFFLTICKVVLKILPWVSAVQTHSVWVMSLSFWTTPEVKNCQVLLPCDLSDSCIKDMYIYV